MPQIATRISLGTPSGASIRRQHVAIARQHRLGRRRCAAPRPRVQIAPDRLGEFRLVGVHGGDGGDGRDPGRGAVEGRGRDPVARAVAASARKRDRTSGRRNLARAGGGAAGLATGGGGGGAGLAGGAAQAAASQAGRTGRQAGKAGQAVARRRAMRCPNAGTPLPWRLFGGKLAIFARFGGLTGGAPCIVSAPLRG